VRRKAVYLNDVAVGSAATWQDVAALVNGAVGVSLAVKDIQNCGNEGPAGFYVTLQLHDAAGGSFLD